MYVMHGEIKKINLIKKNLYYVQLGKINYPQTKSRLKQTLENFERAYRIQLFPFFCATRPVAFVAATFEESQL